MLIKFIAILLFTVSVSGQALAVDYDLVILNGRVLAWVTLLFAVGIGGIQPLQA